MHLLSKLNFQTSSKIKGKRGIEIIKRHQALNKVLEKDGIKDLGILKTQLENQGESVKKLFEKALVSSMTILIVHFYLAYY